MKNQKSLKMITLFKLLIYITFVFFSSHACSTAKKIKKPRNLQAEGLLEPPQGTRSFYMALTPFPFDFTQEGVDEAYRIINESTDMICHHFDDGLPWEEALNTKPFHPNVEGELNTRKSKIFPQSKDPNA